MSKFDVFAFARLIRMNKFGGMVKSFEAYFDVFDAACSGLSFNDVPRE